MSPALSHTSATTRKIRRRRYSNLTVERAVREDARYTAADRRFIHALRYNINDQGFVWTSNTTNADEYGCSKRTWQRHKQSMVDRGLVQCARQASDLHTDVIRVDAVHGPPLEEFVARRFPRLAKPADKMSPEIKGSFQEGSILQSGSPVEERNHVEAAAGRKPGPEIEERKPGPGSAEKDEMHAYVQRAVDLVLAVPGNRFARAEATAYARQWFLRGERLAAVAEVQRILHERHQRQMRRYSSVRYVDVMLEDQRAQVGIANPCSREAYAAVAQTEWWRRQMERQAEEYEELMKRRRCMDGRDGGAGLRGAQT